MGGGVVRGERNETGRYNQRGKVVWEEKSPKLDTYPSLTQEG